jgi:hypothetical protein
LSRLLVLLALASASTGCALVEDLNGSEYTQIPPEAGEGGCAGRPACFDVPCLGTADCGDAGNVCAVTASFVSTTSLACIPPDQFRANGALSVQLCRFNPCLNGAACTPQFCPILGTDAGLGVTACGTIPGCR